MKDAVEISGSLLARNTALNLIGRALPLLVAVATIPFITRGLGAERFGILSLVWVIMGRLSIFDLGLGRATTRFVAGALGEDKSEQIPSIVWTSLAVQLSIGVLASIILVIATPILVEQLLNIPSDLLEETQKVFRLLGFSIPVVVCSASLRGVLEAAQRFDLVNAVSVPASSLSFLLPLIGILLGFELPAIVTLLVISYVGTIVVYLILCFRVYPKIRQSFAIDFKILRPLVSFGGWVTISNVLIPILVYTDRFFIGALSTIADVGYYSVSYDAVSRLGILPGTLAMTLFPAISTLESSNLESDKDKLESLYARSLKHLLLVIGPIVLVLVVFAGDILHLWLGSDWASKTTLVFQILAVGMLVNTLAQVPANFLDGIGRPDLRTKVFLSYAVVYVGLLWFLITNFGVVGAALAWTLRGGLELLLFFGVVWRIMDLRPTLFTETGLSRAVMVYGGIAASTLLMIVVFARTFLIRSTVSALCLAVFLLITWIYVLDDIDRRFLFSAVSGLEKW